jgi:hypothetical protein
MYIFRINKEKLGLFKHRGKTYLRLIENTSAFGFKRKYVLLKTLRRLS